MSFSSVALGLYIRAKKGEDLIVAAAFNTLYAGAGNDRITLHAFSFNDVIYAEAGNDFIGTTVNTKNPTIYGGLGNDTIRTDSSVKAYADGGAGNDLFIPLGSSTNTLIGGAGNDTFWFIESTTATISGGEGNNFYRFDPYYLFGPYHNNITITDISKNDTIRYDAEGSESDYLSWRKDSNGNIVLEDMFSNNFTITLQGVKDLSQVADVTYYAMEDTEIKTLGEIFGVSPKPDNPEPETRPDREPVSMNSAQTAIKILEDYEEMTFDVADYGTKFKTIDGSAATVDLEILGNKLANKIYGGDGSDTIDGGKGNDTLTGGDGEDIFVYNTGDGNDVITDYAEGEDKIQIAPSDFKSASIKGSDVIFAIGNGKLTVKNGKNQEIILVDEDGEEFDYNGGGGQPVSINSAQTAIKILDNFEETTFDVADYGTKFKTIDGSAAMVDLEIFGNKLANKIIGGDGSDTIDGGKGNDTLTGGNGEDIFVYNTGDGNDVITDYSEGEDKIQIDPSDFKSASIKGSDVIFAIGSGKLTVKNGKNQEIILVDEDGEEFDYNGGGGEPVSINSAQTAIKILESYEETTFDVADYGTKFKTIDGSAATVDLEIFGNKLANKIYGGDGSDTLTGGAGNDSLWGNDGSDTFIYDTGDGKDVIFGFEDSDMLEIMDTFTATYNKSKNQIAFKVGSTSNAITLRDFTAATFNINGDTYQISGTKLVQK